jgi:hypothetical protein
VRANSAFYGRDVIAATGRAGARFSVTARQDPAVRAIASIEESAWTTIRLSAYPARCSTSSLASGSATPRSPRSGSPRSPPAAEKQAVTARLIVHRVRDANPARVVANEQGELFPAWRHHAVFTDSPLTLVQAEADHRRNAIIEQVIADLKNGPLAHLPSGRFNANGAWLVLASMAFNLTRASGALASRFHARANTATIRRQLINVPARPVRSARRVQLRLPANWPWADDWLDLFTAALSPPAAIAA